MLTIKKSQIFSLTNIQRENFAKELLIYFSEKYDLTFLVQSTGTLYEVILASVYAYEKYGILNQNEIVILLDLRFQKPELFNGVDKTIENILKNKSIYSSDKIEMCYKYALFNKNPNNN
ncbi:MAG: hypothetical protein ABIO79_11210 [Ferruginibacter sp.]